MTVIQLDGHRMFERAAAEADDGLVTFYNVELIETGQWHSRSYPWRQARARTWDGQGWVLW
jgi:hypothetical protein